MYFTLAVSAAAPGECAAMVRRACAVDPRIMPIPGPVRVLWRAPDECGAIIIWGDGDGIPSAGTGDAHRRVTSHGGTIWAWGDEPTVFARTAITRVDPVYLAPKPGVMVLSDRATWAAAVTDQLSNLDPVMVAAFLNLGFPLDSATPFAGVRALSRETSVHATSGVTSEYQAWRTGAGSGTGAAGVAAALVDSVTWLRGTPAPVKLSLTGGKDSRLIAATLVAAGVPVTTRTHGFADHPDVVVARLVADRLGIEHTVTEPALTPAAGSSPAVQEVDVHSRLRATVLVSDGMLSAFENVGRPDPDADKSTIVAGGHGGELLRGGYAATIAGYAGPLPRALSSAELFRRLTTRRLRLLRPGAAAGYLASLTPWAAPLARSPQRALDDFYLANRAGRWSAAARQAYAIRSTLIQPFFDDRVVRAARRVALGTRVSDRLQHAVLAELCPALLDIPLAGDRWKCDPPGTSAAGHTAAVGATAPIGTPRSGHAPFDWRLTYGDEVASFLRDYILDTGGSLFDVVSKPAAERLLRPPHTDPAPVWALATLTALMSQDWLNARNSGTRTFKIRSDAI